MKKILIATSLFFAANAFSTPTFASVNCTTNTCTGPIKDLVSGLFPTDDGRVFFTSEQMISKLACVGNGPNGQHMNVVLPSDHESKEELYSLVLFALSTNAPVSFRMTNESINNGTNCTVAYIRLDL